MQRLPRVEARREFNPIRLGGLRAVIKSSHVDNVLFCFLLAVAALVLVLVPRSRAWNNDCILCPFFCCHYVKRVFSSRLAALWAIIFDRPACLYMYNEFLFWSVEYRQYDEYEQCFV